MNSENMIQRKLKFQNETDKRLSITTDEESEADAPRKLNDLRVHGLTC